MNIDDLALGFAVADLSAAPSAPAGWRIEKREYRKKNGETMIYYNYRARASVLLDDGRRVVPYRPGGKYHMNEVKSHG